MLPTLCGIIAAPPPYSSVLVDGAVELITVALAPSPPEAAQQIHAAATPAMLQVGRQPWQEGPGRPSFQQRIEAPRHALCSELGLGLPKGVHAACPGSTVHRRLPFMPPGQRATVLSAAHCCRCTRREHRRWPAFTPALVAPAHRPCSSCRSPCSWCCVMTTARCCAAPQRTCAPCCRCSAGAWGSGCPSPVLRPAPFERMNRPGGGQSGGAAVHVGRPDQPGWVDCSRRPSRTPPVVLHSPHPRSAGPRPSLGPACRAASSCPPCCWRCSGCCSRGWRTGQPPWWDPSSWNCCATPGPKWCEASGLQRIPGGCNAHSEASAHARGRARGVASCAGAPAHLARRAQHPDLPGP